MSTALTNEYSDAVRGGAATLAAYFLSHKVDVVDFLRFLQRRRVSVSRFYELLDVVLCCGRDKKEFLSSIRDKVGFTGACSKTFSDMELVYVCRTCQFDDTWYVGTWGSQSLFFCLY